MITSGAPERDRAPPDPGLLRLFLTPGGVAAGRRGARWRAYLGGDDLERAGLEESVQLLDDFCHRSDAGEAGG